MSKCSASHMQVMQIMCKSCASHVQVTCKSFKSFTSHMQVMQIMCKSCAWYVLVMSKSCANHVQIMCKSFASLVQVDLRVMCKTFLSFMSFFSSSWRLKGFSVLFILVNSWGFDGREKKCHCHFERVGLKRLQPCR
jgi:hypothetical protein